jgi:hypothetical protein
MRLLPRRLMGPAEPCSVDIERGTIRLSVLALLTVEQLSIAIAEAAAAAVPGDIEPGGGTLMTAKPGPKLPTKPGL